MVIAGLFHEELLHTRAAQAGSGSGWPRSAGCLIAAERELVIRRRGEPIARVLPMTPQRRLPSHADLRQRMPSLQASSAELIRNERDEL